MSEGGPLLAVRDLVVEIAGEDGTFRAVDGVSFDIARRTKVALVGESGSGKTVTAHAILRLLPTPPARVTAGKVLFDGADLLALPERAMRKVRGQRISIIFQDPMSALNPSYTVGSQVMEAYRIHHRGSRREAQRKGMELLERVGFPEARSRFRDYPHELSGGMRQRVMIAIALACDPALVIADEPTTALDTLAAAQIGALLADLERERDMSLLLISHDLTSVAERAEQAVVLYAGQVVELGRAAALLTAPQHPYTRALVQSVPPLLLQRRRRRPTPTRLPAIAGAVPNPLDPVAGCRFANRCPQAHDRCRAEAPALYPCGDGGRTRCFLHEDGAAALTRAATPAEDPPRDEERS